LHTKTQVMKTQLEDNFYSPVIIYFTNLPGYNEQICLPLAAYFGQVCLHIKRSLLFVDTYVIIQLIFKITLKKIRKGILLICFIKRYYCLL